MVENNVLASQDGSNTLVSEKFGVSYHSKYGAIDESITVFLSAGLQYHLLKGKTELNVFEMGFGTGLNAFLTLLEAEKSNADINYTTIEAYPISLKLAKALGYPEILSPENKDEFLEMHILENAEPKKLSKHFRFTKIIANLEDYFSPDIFDLIYYDAFAPSSQEELWTEEMMEKMYKMTKRGGILVTYCAKGSFKRALKSAGYEVEALPGPRGKREMTRAIKR